MVTQLVLSLLAVGASSPAAPDEVAAVRTAKPPVQLWLSRRNVYRGDRVEIKVRTAADGYLLVLHAEPDGRIRVLYPLDPFDDHYIRGGRKYEVKGRGNRDAFEVYQSEGVGTVFAAYSRDPFQVSTFARGDHWDQEILESWRIADDADPESELVALAQQLTTTAFDYDLLQYDVGRQVFAGYRPSSYLTFYGSPYGFRRGHGSGLSFSLGFRFGRRHLYGSRFGFGSCYDPFYYDPFYCDSYFAYGAYDPIFPYWYDPFYYGGFYQNRFHRSPFAFRTGFVSHGRRNFGGHGRNVVFSDYTFKPRPLAEGQPARVRPRGVAAEGRRVAPSRSAPARRGGDVSSRRIAPSRSAPARRGGAATRRKADRGSAASQPARRSVERPAARPARPGGRASPKDGQRTRRLTIIGNRNRGRDPAVAEPKSKSSGRRTAGASRQSGDRLKDRPAPANRTRRAAPSRTQQRSEASQRREPQARRATPSRSSKPAARRSASRRDGSAQATPNRSRARPAVRSSGSRKASRSAGPSRSVSRGRSAAPSRSRSVRPRTSRSRPSRPKLRRRRN